MIDYSQYRPCVGVIMFNTDGQVWIGKRFGHNGPYCWQFPQGGIDVGEAPQKAALREAWEETGVNVKNLTLLDSTQDWLLYHYPEDYKARKAGKIWRGQKQKWFAYLYNGDTSDFDLKAHEQQEFSEWRWGHLEETPDLIIPFKREVYEHLAYKFKAYANPLNSHMREHG